MVKQAIQTLNCIVTKKFGTVDPHPPKVYDKVLKKLLFPIDKRVENYYNSIK